MQAPRTKQLQYRQGDILLVRIDKLPRSAARVEQTDRPDRVVLAYGEETGHAHAISSRQAELFRDQDSLYLQARPFAKLVHEEHAPIVLAAGTYRVVQQRQFNPYPKYDPTAARNADPYWEYAMD